MQEAWREVESLGPGFLIYKVEMILPASSLPRDVLG